LGDGGFGALSPDGKWAVAENGSPAKLTLLPTGVGEPRQLTDDKVDHARAVWTPDGKSIVYTQSDPGRSLRTYILDVQGGAPRAITPEGVTGYILTFDGKYLLAADSKREVALYPLAGGDPQKVNFTLGPDESPLRFLADGKSLLLRSRGIPVDVTRIDLATGRRELWKQIVPPDPAGAQRAPSVRFSADGKSYAYSLGRMLSDLYVVDGLK
jgi:dipeptidyl aminopeptidase/acylaminoacyl peptidase